jgi:hypothetical protein
MLVRSRITPEAARSRSSPLASDSVGEHLLRGGAGLIVAGLAVFLTVVVGPVSLLLLPLTALAWRGCPTCWTVGLIATMSDARRRRDCARCREVAQAQHPRSAGG